MPSLEQLMFGVLFKQIIIKDLNKTEKYSSMFTGARVFLRKCFRLGLYNALCVQNVLYMAFKYKDLTCR